MKQGWMKAWAIAIACFVAVCQTAQAQSQDTPVFVQTEVVGAASQSVTRQFFGQVAALETVDLSFEVGGYIETLEAPEGASIEEGTVLARLDIAPFARAVERSRLALAQAERDLIRAQQLATRNVTSEVQAENLQTARDLADVALREAEAALADAAIIAPFKGIVADRLGTEFTTIQPGQPILRLHNMSETRVEFELPERLLAQIGDPSVVTFEGHLAGLSDPIPLAFREYRAETAQIGQSYTLSLAAELAADQLLLPGRTIRVHASIDRPTNGIIVPQTAITTRADGQTVVVALDGNGPIFTARHVPVSVASTNGAEFIVTGLPAETEIVTIGAHLVPDGAAVKRFVGLTVEGL